ncbi:MAG: T9SS type A sorting domain-containing protein, partial [Gemmatimonadetes bacterium]|nr:T9SS type A sorting domain-containing protein [Gemmatimonadota bacterium]
SPTFADTDRDGDLDIVIAHWGTGQAPGHFFRNDGPGTFSHIYTSADVMWGYQNWSPPPADWTFCFNLTDLNGDMWPDFTVSSDFNTSHVWLNDGDGTFTDVTDSLVITDTNGMGSTVGDYDNDGDIDWFVSSIYDTTGTTQDGNRLYQNDGNGVFTDVTTAAGVRDGLWGWGATMQDFNNDGHLDIFHVNGWDSSPQWTNNPARLFVSNGDGTFTDQAAAVGVDHTGQGRAVSAFDYDRDGDLDLFLFNTNQLPVLLRNDCAAGNWLDVKLIGSDANTEGIGSRVRATVGATTQTREIRCGNNFNSQDAAEAHFGLGTDTVVDVLEVTWMDGTTTTMNNVPANQRLVITQGSAVTVPLVNPISTDHITLLGTTPNPFRQATEIRFSLAATGPVSVKIYDAGGRAVRNVLDGVRNAGEHTVAWDGRAGSGERAASGIYYYVVRSGDDRAQGKVALLR